jgi:hypothetical protein
MRTVAQLSRMFIKHQQSICEALQHHLADYNPRCVLNLGTAAVEFLITYPVLIEGP